MKGKIVDLRSERKRLVRHDSLLGVRAPGPIAGYGPDDNPDHRPYI